MPESVEKFGVSGSDSTGLTKCAVSDGAVFVYDV